MKIALNDLEKHAHNHDMHGNRWDCGNYIPTKFDNMVNKMESYYEVDAIWNKIRTILLETNDEDVRYELIESYGNSKVGNELKKSLLEKILLDNSIHKSSKKKALLELKEPFWEDDEWPEFLKCLYHNVDDEMRQYLCYKIITIEFEESGIKDSLNKDDNIYLERLIWYFCSLLNVYSQDEILNKIKDKYLPKYGKQQILNVLNYILKHEYVTVKTHSYVEYVMEMLNK